jgi:hypothetical protein
MLERRTLSDHVAAELHCVEKGDAMCVVTTENCSIYAPDFSLIPCKIAKVLQKGALYQMVMR